MINDQKDKVFDPYENYLNDIHSKMNTNDELLEIGSIKIFEWYM